MYEIAYNKNGTVKHADECKMAFGKKDVCCHRCQELLNGDAPRQSFHKDWINGDLWAAYQASDKRFSVSFDQFKMG